MQTNDNIDPPQQEINVKQLEMLATTISAKAAERGLTDEIFDQLMSDVS